MWCKNVTHHRSLFLEKGLKLTSLKTQELVKRLISNPLRCGVMFTYAPTKRGATRENAHNRRVSRTWNGYHQPVTTGTPLSSRRDAHFRLPPYCVSILPKPKAWEGALREGAPLPLIGPSRRVFLRSHAPIHPRLHSPPEGGFSFWFLRHLKCSFFCSVH